MAYVENQSIWLDFKIMCKTVKVMVAKEGINAPDQEVGAARFSNQEMTETETGSK